jgi:hypothetical protein
MCRALIPLAGVLSICVGSVQAMAGALGASPAKAKPIPPFSELQQAVLRHFQAQPDYRPNDLITREEVGPLLAELQRKGYPLADAQKILNRMPAKDEFLAVQWGTPDGRAFMRRIAAYPLAYDRFDRLGSTPQGRQALGNLKQGYAGEKLIEYMTTKGSAKELGKLLSNAATGDQFNAPTGRIYTVAQLLPCLQQSYADALKAAAKRNG